MSSLNTAGKSIDEEVSRFQNKTLWQNTILNVTVLVFDKVLGHHSFTSKLSKREAQGCRNAASLYTEISKFVTNYVVGTLQK